MAIFDDNTTRRAGDVHRLDQDFSRARQKAFMEELMGLFCGKSRRLLPFSEVREGLEIAYAVDRGVRTVPLDAIIGSEGRYKSFNRHFLPLDEDLRERWKKVNAAARARKKLPPVELYKVKEAYFVKDGHHRISVARTQGAAFIEAKVFEYPCDVALDKETDLDRLAIAQTYHRFLKDTRLHDHAPQADLRPTLLGGYTILMEQIQAHQRHLQSLDKGPVPLPRAAASWYDRVYRPLAEVIERHHIMRRFAHRTVTDFYIWMSANRRELARTFLSRDAACRMVEAYAQKYDTPFRKMLGTFRRWLGLVRYR